MIDENTSTKAAREKIGMARGERHPWGSQAKASSVLAFTVLALVAYPAGGVMHLLADGKWANAGGFLLIAVALLACAPVAASRIYQIASEDGVKIDEFELQMRLKAMSSAYTFLIGLVALAFLYLVFAADGTGLWMPTTYDHYNAIFWGFLLYAMLLPVLFVSLKMARMRTETD